MTKKASEKDTLSCVVEACDKLMKLFTVTTRYNYISYNDRYVGFELDYPVKYR